MNSRFFRFAATPGVAAALSYTPWLGLLAAMSYASWFITDDAFIAFRYVRNLVEGHGLVFNPGERVEGYSSFLQVLELAAIWKVFGIPPEDAAQWLSVGWTAGVIALLLWWVRHDAALRGHRGLAGWMALGLVCGSATFAVWTSGGGLETRQFTFFTMAAVVALAVHNGSRRGLLAASFGLAGAALTRPEGVLIAACCFVWFAASRMLAHRRVSGDSAGSDASHGRIDRGRMARFEWRELACLAAPFVLIVAAHLAFRLAYYGEWLPNTYYAKIVRPWWGGGFRYYLAAAVDTGLYLLLPLALLALRTAWRSRGDISYALPLLCIFVHIVGVMRVGGDHFEYRPLDFYWPLLSVPVSAAILDLGSRLSRATFLQRFIRPTAPYRHGSPAGARLLSLIIFTPVLFYCSAIQGTLLLAGAHFVGYTNRSHIELNHRNAKLLLLAPGMEALASISNDLRRLAANRSTGLPFFEHRAYAAQRFRQWRPYEGMDRGSIPADAVAAEGSIGILSYYLPDLKIIDMHGLTDATIARNLVRTPNHIRQMAHDRQPPFGYLESRGVNIRIHPAVRSEARALLRAPFALQLGPDLWMPFASVHNFHRFDFDYETNFDESIAEKFQEYTPSVSERQDLDDLLGKIDSPLIRSDYDVYLVDGYLVYKKENHCWGDDSGASYPFPSDPDGLRTRFFLHVFPVDPNDLPIHRRRPGFDGFDFDFDMIGRYRDGTCAAARRLPDYAIASIHTGEFIPIDNHLLVDNRHIWEGRVNFVEAAVADGIDVEELLDDAGSPVVRADYDVYLAKNHILYEKAGCGAADVEMRFFLHVFPAIRDDLPSDRRRGGFDNLDFDFREAGRYREGTCSVARKLPDYPISAISTGQFTDDGLRVWEGRIDIVTPPEASPPQ